MRRIVWWLVTLAIPVILVALNVRLLATDAFLQWEYGRAGFPSTEGMTDEERLALAAPSTAFIVGAAVDQDLAALRHGGERLYEENEIAHLVDVRTLVRRLSVLGLLSLAVVSGSGLVAWREPRRRAMWWRSIQRGGLLTAALVLAAGLGVVLAWRTVFTGFHQLLFPPGTWQFSMDSGLIRLFPDRFWYDSAIAFAVLLLIESVVVYATGWIGRNATPEPRGDAKPHG